ncbi:MAG: hypothetical protein JWO94_1900 [Verrucomicrobiaceae bacterium]|nr:hypothetical protein [Verrucomicrobiaceae bacterium]
MHRLRCGVIYTNPFAAHLTAIYEARTEAETGKVLSLEYTRATTGSKQVKEWWRMDWVPGPRVEEHCRFLIGKVPVGINQQSQRGLKDRCLDFREGTVVIR